MGFCFDPPTATAHLYRCVQVRGEWAGAGTRVSVCVEGGAGGRRVAGAVGGSGSRVSVSYKGGPGSCCVSPVLTAAVRGATPSPAHLVGDFILFLSH